MADAQVQLPHNRHGVGAQVIVVYAHTAEHRVLDGHEAPIHAPCFHRLEDIPKRRMRARLHRPERPVDGLFAVGTGLPLKSNPLHEPWSMTVRKKKGPDAPTFAAVPRTARGGVPHRPDIKEPDRAEPSRAA